MKHKTLASSVLGTLAVSASLATATVIPTRPHETLEVELHAMRDKLTLYMGDPQELLRLDCRPRHVNPRVEYSPQARAKLTIRDPHLFERQGSDDGKGPQSAEQTWEARLYPSGPTTFRLQIDDGEGVLDFTDFEVQEVRVKAPNSSLDIEFGRENPIAMDVFGAVVEGGSIEFRKMLNARAKTMAFILTGSVGSFEITGKPHDGETSIVFEGEPELLNLVLSKKVGWHIDGPAEALAQIQSKELATQGKSLVSKDFEKSKCRIRLNLPPASTKMTVRWD